MSSSVQTVIDILFFVVDTRNFFSLFLAYTETLINLSNLLLFWQNLYTLTWILIGWWKWRLTGLLGGSLVPLGRGGRQQ